MKAEEKLLDFICSTKYEDIPPHVMQIVRNQLLTIFGTTIAGARSDGCEFIAKFYAALGGKDEANIFIHGGKIPAQDAAYVNAVMARALDFCDAINPGPHIGAAAIPTAFAASELAHGCSGKDFITALAVATEVGARLNLSEEAYDGFDPTGICVVFASTTISSKILGLSRNQIWNALGLSLNKCGGSFQSHIDGSLGVRLVQGWVAQSGIICSRFASGGLTGPKNFLEGIYGYFHLYGKDMFTAESLLGDLGERFELENLLFKKYPSCGLTLGSTDAILNLILDENLSAEEIEKVEVVVPPYTYKLVGHDFKLGENPQVNAQFNIQYCVANALLRRSSKLFHFQEECVRDPRILDLIKKITVRPDKSLEKRGNTPLDMHVLTVQGKTYTRSMDVSPGFPGNPITEQDHETRFWDCMDFGGYQDKGAKIIEFVNDIQNIEDVRTILPLLTNAE